MIGKQFGYLTVIGDAGKIPAGKQRQSAWICKCRCNKIVTVRESNLKRNTKSCGCWSSEVRKQRRVDLTGKQFNDLLVINFVEMKQGNSYWNCRCDCGNFCIVSAPALKQGQKSCGCKQGWWRATHPGLWKDKAAYARWQRTDPAKKIRNSVSNSIRGMLTHNGGYKRKKSIRNYLPYTIDELKIHLENLWEPWMNWSNYGGKSSDQRKTWQIDHIIPHSLFVYTSMEDQEFLECWALSNLRPLEKKANMSKGNKCTLLK